MQDGLPVMEGQNHKKKQNGRKSSENISISHYKNREQPKIRKTRKMPK